MRYDGIDLLRGLSILAVLLLHVSLRMRFAGHSLESEMPARLFHFLFWNGNNGVTVFFAVSGFLITLTSIRRFGDLSHLTVPVFYRLRFARIAPLLLLLLGILSVLHLRAVQGFEIDPKRASLSQALFAALTFHLNWLEAQRGYLPASWDVLWSLSVEEMFYLGFPLLCRFMYRANRNQFVGFLFLFVLAGPFARTAWTTNEIWREKSYLGGMDAISMGCLSALFANRLLLATQPRRWLAATQAATQAGGFALILLIAFWPPWDILRSLGRAGLDGTILALGACLVCIAAVLRPEPWTQWSAPLRWLGRHSYEVYLTHEFVVIWGTQAYVTWPRGHLALWFVAIVSASAMLGAFVAKYFSEPMNRKLRSAIPAAESLSSVPDHARTSGQTSSRLRSTGPAR
jgi:peptidoglycan/LPS O-acetylase OafA/YrhL